MSQSLSVLAKFSKSYVTVSNDNKVHLWETDSKKEKRSYVEKNHLSHSYTCVDWKQTEKNNLGFLAVGCSDGNVIVWDLSRGVVARTIGTQHEHYIPSDVIFANDANSIFVSSSQNQILQYRIDNGELIKAIKTGKKGVARMCINPQVDALAIAGTSIKLLDIASGRRRKLTSSFPGGVSSMCFTQCGCYLVVCGADNREVLVFDVQATAKSSSPIAVIGVTGLPTKVVARTTDSNALEILVLFEEANGAVVSQSLEESDDGAFPSPTISNIIARDEIFAGCFGKFGEENVGEGISLVLGQRSKPTFLHTSYMEKSNGHSNRAMLPKVIISTETNGTNNEVSSNNASNNNNGHALAAPTVLGPHETGGVKRPLIQDGAEHAVEAPQSTKKSKKSSDLVDANILNADGSEKTIEERLESLSAQMSAVERLKNAKSATNKTDSSAVVAVPTSDSLVVLIDQALQSGDDSLLEQCLGCEDMMIVDTTARSMPAARIVAFLKKLVAKFEKRPSRGILLTHWLSCVLKHHTSFLISIPDLSFQLAGLSQMLEQRLATYSRLASLGGRLDLLMQQISTSRGSESDAASAVLSISEPLQVYEEE